MRNVYCTFYGQELIAVGPTADDVEFVSREMLKRKIDRTEAWPLLGMYSRTVVDASGRSTVHAWPVFCEHEPTDRCGLVFYDDRLLAVCVGETDANGLCAYWAEHLYRVASSDTRVRSYGFPFRRAEQMAAVEVELAIRDIKKRPWR